MSISPETLNLHVKKKEKQINIEKQARNAFQSNSSCILLLEVIMQSFKKNKNERLGKYALIASYYDLKSIT